MCSSDLDFGFYMGQIFGNGHIRHSNAPFSVSYTHLDAVTPVPAVPAITVQDCKPVIKDLLMNPVYTGAIASEKKDYRFKNGTIGEKKLEDWIVVVRRHEPRMDRMSFDIVQNKLKSRQRPGQTNDCLLYTSRCV